MSGCLHGLSGLLAIQNLYVHKKEDILAISNAMLDLHVPGLGQADRQLALTILLQLLQVKHLCPVTKVHTTVTAY